VLALLSVAALLAACGAEGVQTTAGEMSAPSDATAAVIDRYRDEIPRLMKEEGIPGVSVAVVDDRSIVWAAGFGVTDNDDPEPVTVDTVFSVQSMSKAFTATAVLRAVQDGLVDLDTPITTYLPDFTVHSIFEDRPESRITLRHLLSHTAGFTHEAPIGNNWDGDADSFAAHIRSISGTWLRFPVGSGFAYSNLGIDLAGYILQVVSGQPFADYVARRVFEPLGMTDSSFDADVIAAADDLAIGHDPPAPPEFRPVPMVPSGGMYASVNDLARFLRFQLTGGRVDGRTVLDPALLDEMRTVQFPDRGGHYGYGLGVGRTGWYAGRNADLFLHGGGGFGFTSDLCWLPELRLGVAVLFNSVDHDLQTTLGLGILDDLAHARGPYRDRLFALPAHSPVSEDWGDWLPPPGLAADIRARARPPDPTHWQAFLGEYQTANGGVLDVAAPPSRLYEQNGQLYLDGTDTEDGTYRLHEVEPGLFFTETGEALDLRTQPPTFRNLRLTRVGPGPAPMAWALLVLCGLVMLAAVILLPLRRLRLVHRHPPAEPVGPGARRALGRAAATAAIVVSLSGVASIIMVAVLPRIIYTGYVAWLDLATWQEIWFRAPVTLALSTVALAALTAAGWRHARRKDPQLWIRGVLILAALVEISFLAAWHLIGVS
jgi:CubicO group peptidase (beta-lactamase class C family)